MIRKATINDLEVIVQYNYNMAKETEDLELDWERLTEGVRNILSDETKGIYFVCELDGIVAGQMMITLEWSDWRNGYFWWIQSVYISREYRGQGVFRQLYNHVEKLALSKDDVCGLRLYVDQHNHRAQKTYQSCGMHKTGYHMYEVTFARNNHK